MTQKPNKQKLSTNRMFNFNLLCVFMLLCVGCSSAPLSPPASSALKAIVVEQEATREEISDTLSLLPMPQCDPDQLKYYDRGVETLRLYIKMFFNEFDKLISQSEEDFRQKIRRSEMTIMFGEGLLRRISMFEVISSCDLLWGKYLKERQTLFLSIEKELLDRQ